MVNNGSELRIVAQMAPIAVHFIRSYRYVCSLIFSKTYNPELELRKLDVKSGPDCELTTAESANTLCQTWSLDRYLILHSPAFSTGGCIGSVFLMLEQLSKNGYAPLVVSNAPLAKSDIDKLKKCSWKILQRPNFAYDFGGYRDGVWYLENHLKEIDSILFINDTIFFPLRRECDFLTVAKARPEPYIGIADGVYHDDPAYAAGRWYDALHITSYFFLVKKPIVESQSFWDYWNNYRMRSDKVNVVKNGEVGVYSALKEAGWDHWVYLQKHELLEKLAGLSTEDLMRCTKNIFSIRRVLVPAQDSILASIDRGDIDWEYLIKFLQELMIVVNTSDCLPYDGIRVLGYPMIKTKPTKA